MTRSGLVALCATGLMLTSACADGAADPATAPGDGEVPAAEVQIPAPPAPGQTSELRWVVPEGWVEETPSSSMRRGQYRISGDAGDAEMAVFYFGPGQGGDPQSNADRWVGQFRGADGQPLAPEAVLIEQRTVGAIDVLVVEVRGTYVGGMGPAMGGGEAKEGQMMLGAIAAGPDANWFFKMLGPEATMEENRSGFEELLGSLR